MDSSIRYAIENGILTTYLYADLLPDFEDIVSHSIDETIFSTNITTKAVARAIKVFQDEDKPLDDVLICNFISQRMPFDYREYEKILTSKPLSYKLFCEYYDDLVKEKEKKSKGALYARI